MANAKISQLSNSLTKSTVATNDVLPIVDTSATETKKLTYQELVQPTDANFRIAGSSDITKLVAFEVDGLTTATTRTITIPDADLTLVGLTTAQTLTNKTLTAPQINFGSDATGDLIYRTGAGVTARLPIGSTDQILAVQAGIPTWIANPTATSATTSTAGIVELATTAETTTGTDTTRAVTPDGLHDMTSLAGAAWFLDEDTMSSNSDTKTASQQSIKAYVDTSVGSVTVDIPMPVIPTVALGTRALSNNVDGYIGMFSFKKSITVNKITFNVTAVGASGTFNVGLFSVDGGTRYFSVTSGTVSGTGLVTISVSSVIVHAGNYYLLLGSVDSSNITLSRWTPLATDSASALRDITSEPTLCGTYTVTASTMPATITPSSIGSSDNGGTFLFRIDN